MAFSIDLQYLYIFIFAFLLALCACCMLGVELEELLAVLEEEREWLSGVGEGLCTLAGLTLLPAHHLADAEAGTQDLPLSQTAEEHLQLSCEQQ